MLIDSSYFTKGPRKIENATLGKIPDANSIKVVEKIDAYIAEYQERFLRKMLGYLTGNKVNAYLVCLDDDEEPRHNEAFDAVCEQLRESFADYVFFYILRDSNAVSTVTGLVRLKCANDYVSPIVRQVHIWNSMVDRNNDFVEWSKSDECTIKGISISSYMITKINRFNL